MNAPPFELHRLYADHIKVTWTNEVTYFNSRLKIAFSMNHQARLGLLLASSENGSLCFEMFQIAS